MIRMAILLLLMLSTALPSQDKPMQQLRSESTLLQAEIHIRNRDDFSAALLLLEKRRLDKWWSQHRLVYDACLKRLAGNPPLDGALFLSEQVILFSHALPIWDNPTSLLKNPGQLIGRAGEIRQKAEEINQKTNVLIQEITEAKRTGGYNYRHRRSELQAWTSLLYYAKCIIRLRRNADLLTAHGSLTRNKSIEDTMAKCFEVIRMAFRNRPSPREDPGQRFTLTETVSDDVKKLIEYMELYPYRAPHSQRSIEWLHNLLKDSEDALADSGGRHQDRQDLRALHIRVLMLADQHGTYTWESGEQSINQHQLTVSNVTDWMKTIEDEGLAAELLPYATLVQARLTQLPAHDPLREWKFKLKDPAATIDHVAAVADRLKSDPDFLTRLPDRYLDILDWSIQALLLNPINPESKLSSGDLLGIYRNITQEYVRRIATWGSGRLLKDLTIGTELNRRFQYRFAGLVAFAKAVSKMETDTNHPALLKQALMNRAEKMKTVASRLK